APEVGATSTPLNDSEIPQSLPITKLVKFTHKGTGISGLRPDNWTIFSGKDSFQISSSPNAPAGFIGQLMPLSKLPNGDFKKFFQQMVDQFSQTKDKGDPPEIIKQTVDDQTGLLQAKISSNAQGSTKVFRLMMTMRITKTAKGVVLSM